MEKICSWLWRPEPNASQREDAFHWVPAEGDAPDMVVIGRGDAMPTAEDIAALSTQNQTVHGFNAAWMYEMLSRKEYEKLMPNMKNALDFLRIKLGDS